MRINIRWPKDALVHPAAHAVLCRAPPSPPPRIGVDVLAPNFDQPRKVSQLGAASLHGVSQRRVSCHHLLVLGRDRSGGGGGGSGSSSGSGSEDAAASAITTALLLPLLAFAGFQPRGRLLDGADEVQGGLPHDVVVGEGAVVVELPPGEDDALLVDGDARHVLDLQLHGVDSVQGLHVERDDPPVVVADDEDLHVFLVEGSWKVARPLQRRQRCRSEF